eukprot:TRINITY_DN13687_c0_g1_i1.p1 TRINITY_DN13687_c0_g1~~TRINITY_DN13687_c0_g1_i1.p1  ORF type:complete len:121 (+),score=12.46 TRINITY_DN13687_c0_g1_i1:76-438(+)
MEVFREEVMGLLTNWQTKPQQLKSKPTLIVKKPLCESVFDTTTGLPSSRADLTKSMKCKECGKYYCFLTNTTDSCRHHHGTFSPSKGCRKWTCCDSEYDDQEGCCRGKHIRDPSTYEAVA